MKKLLPLLSLLISVCQVFSQNNSMPQESDSSLLNYSIFFIGDIGEADMVDSNIKALKAQMQQVQEKGTILFLGNSISKKHAKTHVEDVNTKDTCLFTLLDMVKNFKGGTIFLPGEKEWRQGHKHGWEALMDFERFIEGYLGRSDVFQPSGGCPGPVEIKLTNEIVLLVVDSQWWLHPGDKPEAECGLENTSDFLILLSDAIKRNRNKKIVFAAHHPIYSAGKHGGNFPFPGPVQLYRKIFGTPQDFAYPFYKQIRHMAKKISRSHENIIFLSAHDNSLQFAKKNNSFYVVSGSGSKAEYVSQKEMDFAISEIGFSRLNFYSNNEVWLEFWSVGEEGEKEAYPAFRTKLFTQKVSTDEDLTEKYKNLNFSDSVVNVAASLQYQTDSKFKKNMLGENYRKEWETPIKTSVFDIGTEKGGLRILKRGGGQQTRSLRLEAQDGKQYVLRSIEKYTEKAMPVALRKTFAAKIIQDGVSGSNPYAALVVPKMAQAVGVYHTNPKIVYVPDDPRFGIYRDDFRNELFLFEERPRGDVSDRDNFGNSKEVMGTNKLLEKRFSDSNFVVDETSVLRARLFDIFLNDWDRHEGQWRWATFKENGKTIARPIPRDRDQAFFYSNGAIPWLARRKWAVPKFQPFDTLVENVVGLGFNSRYFDRSFLQSKTKEDWMAMAENLKGRLNDQVIEEAVKDLPKEIYEISGKEMIEKLKSRRNQLPDLALEFYKYLALQVDVVGTNEKGLLSAKWNNSGNLTIKINQGKKKKEQIYKREFIKNETKEVHLYGLGGKDNFDIMGNNKGVRLRVMGGAGKDKFNIENTKRQNLVVYDTPKTNISGNGKFKNKLSQKPGVNAYNRKSFKYDAASPGANLNFVSDDGLIVGIGINVKKQSFRKKPYGALHKFLINYAFAYPSVELKYSGEVNSIARNIDFLANIKYNTPNFQGYYYGLGNETPNPKTDDDEYNRIRMSQFLVNPQIRKRLAQKHSIFLGAFYQQLNLKATPGRFVTDFANPANDLDPLTDFKTREYLGVNANYIWDTRNDKIIPNHGIYWYTGWKFFKGLGEDDHNFQKIETDLRLFASLGRPKRSILALRFGAAHNTGGYSFYQANKLGLKSNLRGYRQERFAGDAMVYQNTDFRFRLARFRTYFLSGEAGILGFNDFGRIWLNGEDSDKWHHGFGAGFWLSPFKLMVITANFSHSTEDDIFSVEFKYLF